MIINILGVGRSGTTALFTGLQQIIQEQVKQPLASFYEPFLRDHQFLEGAYTELTARFQYIDSLSAEGIFQHTSLPMLIADATHLRSPYLDRIYAKAPKTKTAQSPKLFKYIRANGRYRLLNAVAPEAKSVFILRNPIDVANSIKDRFSFYGGEFHRDDETRFLREVNDYYGGSTSPLDFRNYIDSQLFYWYYMNRFALESFGEVPNKPLIICYEEFFDDLQTGLREMLSFLDIEFKSRHLDFFSAKVGPTTAHKSLHPYELSVAQEYMAKYRELLTEHGLNLNPQITEIADQYNTGSARITEKSKYYGLHSRAVERRLQRAPTGTKPIQLESPKFLHVVNPVIVEEKSDLSIAQPITFETMRNAKAYAELKNIAVQQVAVSFSEDEPLVPSDFGRCRPLTRSCLDYAKFSEPKKLPLLSDILSSVWEHPGSEYIVYTNVDIGLTPHFYETASKLLSSGYDAVNVCRRTLSKSYSTVADLPDMYADFGSDHPGTDCFIFKRSLLREFELNRIIVGTAYVALALRLNLHVFAERVLEVKRKHLTFHIGDDRPWARQFEYSNYNATQLDQIFEQLRKRSDLRNEGELNRFFTEFQRRKAVYQSTKPNQ